MSPISDSSLTASLVFLKKILHGCVSVRRKLRPQLPENKNNKNVGTADSKIRKLEITNVPEVPDSKWFVQVVRWELIGVSMRLELEQSSPEPRGFVFKNDDKTCDFSPSTFVCHIITFFATFHLTLKLIYCIMKLFFSKIKMFYLKPLTYSFSLYVFFAFFTKIFFLSRKL